MYRTANVKLKKADNEVAQMPRILHNKSNSFLEPYSETLSAMTRKVFEKVTTPTPTEIAVVANKLLHKKCQVSKMPMRQKC